MEPAVNFPPAPKLPSSGVPPQGYVQGQYGQYGPRPSGQLFHGAGGMSPQMGNQPFGGQQNNGWLGQQGSMPGNSLFGGTQAPPVTPMGGSGTAFGPQGPRSTGNLGNMGGMNSMGGMNNMGSMGGMNSMGGMGSMAGNGGAGSAWGNNWNNPAGKFGERQEGLGERGKGKGKQGKKKRRVPIWARVIIGILLFFIVLGGAGFAYYQINYASTLNSITGQNFTRPKGETDPNQGKPSDVLNWGRINILLLGSDTDDKGVWTGNSFLAQTVIVASVDTGTHEVDMLSIPRDFYINIPGHGMDKLDTAFAYGGSINNHMSGVTTVVDTLYTDFGIKINFYAWVGLQGFIKVINTVDGVDVNVMHPVVDDTYPDDVTTNGTSKAGFGYRRVYIGDGPQHLDGATALEYVRSRHSTTDFDRSARQQQVLSALRLKMDNVGIVGQLPQIAKDLQGSLATDLNTTQLLELGNFARGIDANKIKHLTLSAPKYGRGASVPVHGQSEDVVLPDCNAIPGAVNAFLHITTATCNIAYWPGGQGPLLTSASGSNSGGVASTSSLADASIIADAGQQALSAGQSWNLATLPSWNNLFGVRDLLDLMFMVVLNSPQA